MMAAEADYYDRQRRACYWDQAVVEQQVGFVFGVGGVGCTVAMDLVRLGFRKVFLVDRDVVDAHNLNRQMLFSKDDVGRSKVEAAKESLQRHNIHTEIVALHMDVLKEWPKIVECAQECTVLFNGIDVGDYWDFAVASLGLRLGIPVVVGGTDPISGHTLTVDFTGPAGKPCCNCLQPCVDKEIFEQLLPAKILDLPNLEFLPHDPQYQRGGSMIYTCSVGCHTMVGLAMQHLLDYPTKLESGPLPNRVIVDMLNWEITKWCVEPDPECPLCSKRESL
mgnify:CR=1 FL=1